MPNGESLGMVSLCSFYAGGRLFGIDTRSIREVLRSARVNRVPLAPSYIAGVIAYRGEVVTAVCLPALLGSSPAGAGCSVVVLDGDEDEPRFGLFVDRIGSVAMVKQSAMSANPSTLDEAGKAIFCGAVRTEAGLLVQLDVERLRPSRLAECGLFGRRPPGEGEMRCGL